MSAGRTLGKRVSNNPIVSPSTASSLPAPRCDRRSIRPNCPRLPLSHPLHFYSAEIYFTYTNYCLCTFLLIIDVTAFVFLPISYPLIQSTALPILSPWKVIQCQKKKTCSFLRRKPAKFTELLLSGRHASEDGAHTMPWTSVAA